jgi:hypothetical protein
VFPALAANTTVHVRGIRAVLEVIPAAGRQNGLKGAGPLIVGPGETEHLVRGKAELADCGLEWFTRIDRIQELIPHFDGKPRLRPAWETCPGGVILRSLALVAVAALSPPDQCAVAGLGSAAATLRIGLVADLMQLLESPRRRRDQAERAPASDDRRRHIACSRRLAD